LKHARSHRDDSYQRRIHYQRGQSVLADHHLKATHVSVRRHDQFLFTITLTSVSFHFAGTITITELKAVMSSLGQNPSDSELQRMILSVDDNGDNEIDFEEFLILMSSSKPSKEDPDRELREAFKVFDSDGSGSISRSEMKRLMKSLGQNLTDKELDAMMDEVDTDGDGEIDFEEFKNMMVRNPLCCIK
jgi:Ca2+-binding EF-hand superfamily protein